MRPALRRSLQAVALTGAVAALAAGAAASALAAGNPILDQCTSGLTRSYTVAQLRHALAIMPAYQKQYTSCVDVIQSALVRARHNGGTLPAASRAGSGGSFLPTPVIIILVVVLVAALGFGALALRRRRSPPEGGPPT